MKVIVQRCSEASVKVDDKIISKINKGYLLLVGFGKNDDVSDIKKVVRKIINLRIFEDENGKINLSLDDVKGEILSVSQFTLYASLNGRRPSFSLALDYKNANELYDIFNNELRKNSVSVKTGEFGADMKVNIVNDGPVTIIIDSKENI